METRSFPGMLYQPSVGAVAQTSLASHGEAVYDKEGTLRHGGGGKERHGSSDQPRADRTSPVSASAHPASWHGHALDVGVSRRSASGREDRRVWRPSSEGGPHPSGQHAFSARQFNYLPGRVAGRE